MHQVLFKWILFAVLILAVQSVLADSILDWDDKATKQQQANSSDAMPVPKTLDGVPASTQSYEYRIGHRDLIAVEVFQAEELNHTSRVNAEGDISLPLLGRVNIRNQTATEAEVAIEAALRAKYLQDPHVTVVIKEYNSQSFTLEGWVKSPGVYPLMGKTTFLQAIAIAKGMDKLADFDEIAIFRNSDGKGVTGYIVSYEKIRSGVSADPVLHSGDVIVVNQSGSKAAWATTKDVLGTFLGWSRAVY